VAGQPPWTGRVAKPRHDHHRDIDAVEADRRHSDRRMMRSCEAEDAIGAVGMVGTAGRQFRRGVPQDYAEALKWYRLAADQGNANAQSNLGVMYVKGQGTTQNHVEALMWFRLAATKGTPTPSTISGLCMPRAVACHWTMLKR
jgi:hypothetical protein